MGVFDNRSDTQREIDEYYRTRNNQGFEGVNNNNYPTNESQYSTNNYSANNNYGADNYNNNYAGNNNAYGNNSYNNYGVNGYNNRPDPNFNNNNGYRNDGYNDYSNYNNYNNYAGNNNYAQQYHNPSPNYDYNNNYPANNQRQNYQNKVYVKPSSKGNTVFIVFFIVFFLLAFSTAFLSNTHSMLVAQILPFLFLGIFTLVGLITAFGPIITGIIKKRRCTYQTKAIVVDMHTRRNSKGRRSYAPVYEYSYGGIQYVARSSTHRNYLLPDIGDEVDILINESNPEDFYVEEKKANIFSLIFGLIFAIVPMYMLITEFLY